MIMSRNVLIVEDESIVAMELEEQLKRLGCQVIGPVSTAAAALGLCEVNLPDLALMDVRIQGPHDGIEAAQLLRQRFDVPVIYLTALADEVTLERAKVSGPASYILKPVGDDELKAAVEIALYKRELEHVLEQQRAEFFAMLSHDIRSPLHAVSGFAKLLALELNEAGQSRAGELLDRMQESLSYVLKLVSEYLALLTIDSQRSNLTSVRLCVNEILLRVKNRYEPEALRRSLRMETQFSDNLPPIEADQSLLERTFDNLLFNALKFTPSGGCVRLSSEARATDLVVSVADTGPGIPSDELPKIFDVGWRRPVDSAKEGSGLGLHIVKTLVNAIGGRVEVESTVGSGTRFSVILPVNTPAISAITDSKEKPHQAEKRIGSFETFPIR
jgi:signal transduction histidine kinase